jgi:tetratricopeptide (TPR) repeat protein
MAHRPNRRTRKDGSGEKSIRHGSGRTVAPSLSRAKRLCFSALALVLVPTLFFLVLELALRLAGFGYSTSFLLKSSVHDRPVYIQNDRFAWRFFSKNFARVPAPFAIQRYKPPGTVRVFVFGESAAYGDPQPEFGLPRMLQAMLSLRYPGIHFEVVNAAMTAINSHAILPIARDCARASGDIWVLYMGNNEVVGPFGAGTVFGPQAPRLALIRSALAAKTTRTGQLVDTLLQKLNPPPPDKSEWGGMLMFLGNQVRSDDSRLQVVYEHFKQNLTDILNTARGAGAGVVVSTVAVNLKDSAPFASQFRPDLSATEQDKWKSLFSKGCEARQAGKLDEALTCFHQAEQIDSKVADLQFMLGQCSLALGQSTEAERRLAAARDLDTLRFRCDSRLNSIIRGLASGREGERIAFADSEQAFAHESPAGIPGAEFFYEHVHLTFEGNYLLARTVADQVAALLPETVQHTTAPERPWPSLADCARRLAWTDCERLAAIDDILGRLNDAPFASQSDHPEQVRRLTMQEEDLRPKAKASLSEALGFCRETLAVIPEDAILHEQYAHLLSLAGDEKRAAESAREAADLLPDDVQTWLLLGGTLARDRKYGDAQAAFKAALVLDPDNIWALQGLGQACEGLGHREGALQAYRQAVKIKPRFGSAWLALARLLEQAGQKNEADNAFRQALANRIHRPGDLATLARFCQDRGRLNEALTNYQDALKLSPGDATLHISTGLCLAALGRDSEARPHYAEAARLAPDSMQAHFLLGLSYGRAGHPNEAATQFREAVRLSPDLVEARINLATALMDQHLYSEALQEFREVLRRNPTNELALKNVHALESAIAASGSTETGPTSTQRR